MIAYLMNLRISGRGLHLVLAGLLAAFACSSAFAAVVQLNSSGGTSTTDGLRIYIEDTSKMQVIRRNSNGTSTGQLFDSTETPISASNRLDNGIFLRANGTLYGPSHVVGTPDFILANNFSTRTISGPSPANPISNGVTQTANAIYGISSGPQISVEYRYLRPYDFVTMNVTLVIPTGYAVSAANPVRYFHAVDTYLGGSDNGCGVTYTDTAGHRVVGTYPPASGTTCPSSTSIPAGVTIVESFRERSGPAFSRYCTTLYSNFWDLTGSYASCAIANPAGLPNPGSVSTTYQDTGIAIEYDFTAAGTYTFSYDLVIGSPTVPSYDHLELQFTPGTNLCSFPVTVKGCLSSTVPCPAGSELNANLTGTVTASGGGGVTWTPSSGTFSIAAGTPEATVTALPGSPGGTITLGAGSLSTLPLNGVKCWNGSSSTCSLTLPNVGCYASDLDACSNLTGTPARCGATGNRLYTKVAGQAMSFDLVALKGAPKTVDTSFNSNAGNPVSVDLVSSSGTAVGANRCPTTSPTALSGVSAQTIAFTSGRPASATSYTVPATQNTRAYRNVWVRFTQGSGTLCSNDRFAIRPASFSTVSSTDANADSAGSSGTAAPVIKAGTAFSLTADTATPGYDGVPGVAPTLIEWASMPVQLGTLAGSFSTAATAATGDGASGSAFTYSEVGYFRFQAQGVYDASFTSPYQDASDSVCVNTAPDDFSNTPNGDGKVGCKFGNSAPTNYFGRFIPDHFDTAVTQACPSGAFSYSGQPFSVAVTAKNAGGTTTRNYQGPTFAKASTLTARDAADTAANPGPGNFSGNSIAASAFVNGAASVTTPAYSFTSSSTLPTVVRVRAADTDNVTSLRTLPATTVEGTTTVRSGRLWLNNAYGSELLPLVVPVKTQYWGTNGWSTNTADSCTALVVPTNANTGLTNTLKAMTTAALGVPSVVAGVARLSLSAPGAGNAGLVDVSGSILRGVNSWLTLAPPVARACFGSCGPRSPVIYYRERY